MALSSDLISQLVKTSKAPKKSSETTVTGTVKVDGRTYVQLDGSEILTPVSTTSSVKDGDRVNVLIKDHTATVTGNVTDPSASGTVVESQGKQISEFEVVIADKVSTKELEAESARINTLVADNVTIKEKLTATEASIEELEAENVTITGKLDAAEAEIGDLKTTKLDAEVADITYATIENLDAANAEIYNLKGTYGDFVVLTTDKFTAIEGDIKDLDTEKLSADEADIKYANIDFSNIGKAAMEYFYANSGLIRDVVVGDGTITGNLVGVTIKGDLIEGNTIKADKLVVLGEDGLYYKLNVQAGTFAEGEAVPTDSLHGSVITAKSVTAEKVSVKDLVAFDATIGGFHITEDSIYSGVKETVDNTTRGIYLDNDGQVAFGDQDNFLKYYKDSDGKYKLEISANSILLSSSGRDITVEMDQMKEDIGNLGLGQFDVGGRNLIQNSVNMMFNKYYFAQWLLNVTHDGAGHVTVDSGDITVEHTEGDNVIVDLSHIYTCTGDEDGNVAIS